MATWSYTPEEVEAARFFSSFLGGPAYGFHLSMRDTCGDNFPVMSINIRGRFEPVESEPVETRSVGAVQIGSSRTRR